MIKLRWSDSLAFGVIFFPLEPSALPLLLRYFKNYHEEVVFTRSVGLSVFMALGAPSYRGLLIS